MVLSLTIDGDEELAAAFARGDVGAFDRLYARWAPRITGYALRMLGRREDAEEVCVETFTRVLEGRWRAEGAFKSWLFTVANRCCLERLRRRTVTDRVLSLFGATSRPADADSPELALIQDERERRLARAIAGLPHEHRAALLLTCSQELSAREVGAVLGLTDQQVRSQLSYARRLLRERLGEEDDA